MAHNFSCPHADSEAFGWAGVAEAFDLFLAALLTDEKAQEHGLQTSFDFC